MDEHNGLTGAMIVPRAYLQWITDQIAVSHGELEGTTAPLSSRTRLTRAVLSLRNLANEGTTTMAPQGGA